jgi:hypothetical protein
MASCLWLPGAAVSHRAAAAWWALEGFPEGPVEITAVVEAKPPASWLSLHRRSRLDLIDIVHAGPVMVTTPTRTLVDLCAVSSLDELDSALDDALRRGLTTLPRLRWAERRLRGKGHSGSRLLRELLAVRGRGYVPLESRLEGRLRRILVRSGLPAPVGQHEVRNGGRLVARGDLAYPRERLAIEADGYRYHMGKTAWQRDLARRNALSALGWTVLHVTWDDVASRPGEVADRVRSTLSLLSLGNARRQASLIPEERRRAPKTGERAADPGSLHLPWSSSWCSGTDG